MRSVGIRELRQQASRYLREVERGETFEVTDRGRPVALLTPVPAQGVRDGLLASGRLRPAAVEGGIQGLGPPPEAEPGEPLSSVLARQRADER